jgi:type III secretory pathway component EscV
MSNLLRSRKFWAAAAALLMAVLIGFLPGFPDLTDPLADISALTAAYILGTAVEGRLPEPGQALRQLLRSRKFWTALAGMAVILLRGVLPDFPIADEQVHAVILSLAAYMLGTGLQDRLLSQGSAR